MASTIFIVCSLLFEYYCRIVMLSTYCILRSRDNSNCFQISNLGTAVMSPVSVNAGGVLQTRVPGFRVYRVYLKSPKNSSYLG